MKQINKGIFWLFILMVSFVSNGQKKTLPRINTRDIESQFIEGMRFYLKEDYQEALLIWESLVSEKKNDPGLYYYLAKANAILSNESNAFLYAEKAHVLSPASLDYGLFYADLLLKKNKVNEAIEVLTKISAFDESQPEVNTRLAQAYLFLEKGEEALKALEKSNHYIGEFPAIIKTKQFIYLKQKRFKEFAAASIPFLENFPEENLLDWPLLEYFNPADSVQYMPVLDSLQSLYPGMKQIDLIKANNKLASRKYQEVENLLKESLSDERIDAEIYGYFLADFMKGLAKNKDSFQLKPLSKAIEDKFPQNAEIVYLSAEITRQNMDHKLAQEKYLQAINLGSKHPEAFAELVSLDMQMEQRDSALVHAERALAVFPSNPFFFFQKGFVHANREETEQEIKTLVAGLPFLTSGMGFYVNYYSMLGDAYHAVNKMLESDEAFEKALKENPEDDHVLNNYSYFLSLRKENLEKAYNMSKKLIDALPEEPTYLDTHGWVCFQMGKYDVAYTFILKAFQLSENPSAEIIEHLGDVFFKLNKPKEALKYWKEAFKKDNSDKILEKKIQKKDFIEN